MAHELVACVLFCLFVCVCVCLLFRVLCLFASCGSRFQFVVLLVSVRLYFAMLVLGCQGVLYGGPEIHCKRWVRKQVSELRGHSFS